MKSIELLKRYRPAIIAGLGLVVFMFAFPNHAQKALVPKAEVEKLYEAAAAVDAPVLKKP